MNQPESYFDGFGNRVDHSHFTYDGNRLTAQSQTSLLFAFTETYTYEGDGNVQQVAKVEGNNTIQLTYGWEPGTHNLLSALKTTNGNTNYSATFEYDRLNRIRKFCQNGGNCHLFSYVGDSDWLSVVKDQYGTVLQRYLYTNGRPLRVDVQYVSWYNALAALSLLSEPTRPVALANLLHYNHLGKSLC